MTLRKTFVIITGMNPAAALAKLRWKNTTPEERSAHAKMMNGYVKNRNGGRRKKAAAEVVETKAVKAVGK